MSVTIEIPEAIEKRLREAWGQDLSQAAKEALAIEGYRSELLSVGQVAELLDMSIDGADGFLKARCVMTNYTPADLESDIASLNLSLQDRATGCI